MNVMAMGSYLEGSDNEDGTPYISVKINSNPEELVQIDFHKTPETENIFETENNEITCNASPDS